METVWLFSVRSLAFRMPYYAVKVGKAPGIFKTWAECESQVHGFPGAVFKKFALLCEAEEFLKAEVVKNSQKRPFSGTSLKENSKHFNLPIKESKRSRTLGTSAVDTLVPVAFMHDIFEADKVLVYTDGSCKGPLNARRAGIGVFWGSDHPWNVSERLKGRQTSNRAEIEACIRALQKASSAGIRGVKIVTDSKFTLNCATVWYAKWQRNGWKLADGKPVLLKEDIQRLVKQLNTPGLQVSWCHTPGHQGKWGNEQADNLAEKGANLPYTYNDENDEDSDDTGVDFTEADV